MPSQFQSPALKQTLVVLLCLLAGNECLATIPCEPPGFPLPTFRAASFNVCDFGAPGDGKTADTLAINKAIEHCASESRGDVLFPPGTYLSSSIHLQSHVRLVIQPGAVIQAAPSSYDTPEQNPNDHYQDFGHSHFHNALFWGVNIENS